MSNLPHVKWGDGAVSGRDASAGASVYGSQPVLLLNDGARGAARCEQPGDRCGRRPRAVTGEAVGDAGVGQGARLIAFTEAVMSGVEATARERETLRAVLSPGAFVDVCTVSAAFNVVDRIADATGIPLDRMLDAMSGDVQRELGLVRFASAANTPGVRRAGLPAMRRATWSRSASSALIGPITISIVPKSSPVVRTRKHIWHFRTH